MELNSLINIKVTSESAKSGSDAIIDSLNKVNVSAQAAKISASNLNAEFDKTGKGVSQSVTSAAQSILNSNNSASSSLNRVSSSYSESTTAARGFSNAVDSANKSAGSFPTDAAKSILAYGAAYISARESIQAFLKINSDFETGMVGVAKTTNLAGQDLENFKNRILQTSKEIPVSTNELLELAQAAGQMGVRGADNLEKFASVMAKISRATDLAGADSARSLARILTVSGESTDKLETLANVIVRMGNNSKATESEIAGMTTRVAQALSVYGIASAQSVALAAGMKSIGIAAEQGGSAVGRSMQEITNAVLGGSEALKTFSDQLNLDPEKLSNLFKTDKIQAFNYFLEGIASKGLGAGLALEKVGLGGTEIASTIIPLASNLNILADAQEQVNDELKNGNALNAEFANVMKTFSSQVEVSGNIIKEYAQTMSADLFQSISSVVKEFNEASQTGGLNRLVDVLSLLSIVIGTRVVVALGSYTAASAKNIAMLMAENAAYTENAARTAANAQITAQSAAQKLQAANAQVIATTAVVEAERAAQVSRIASLKSIADEIVAEKALEAQRIKAQINAQGVALSVNRMAELRLREVAILSQVSKAEATLAATTIENNLAASAAVRAKAAAEIESAAASKIASAANVTAAATARELSVASTLAATASRGLGAAMALLGGPAGAVLLAAGALVYFATRTTDAEAAVKALGDTTEEAVKSFNKLSEVKQARVLDQLKADYADAQKEVERLTKDMDALNKVKNFTTERRRNELAIQLEDASDKAVELKDKLDKLEFQKSYSGLAGAVKEFEDSITPVAEAADQITTSVNNTADATKKLVQESEKLVALYVNKKKAVEFAYDVEHGLVDEMDAKTKQLILTNYKLYDSIVASEQAWKDLGDMADKEMSDVLDRANKNISKSIEESLGKRPDWLPSDEEIAASKKAAEESARPWIEASNRIDSAFADMFANGFSNFTSFKKQMVAGWKKLAGEIIHQMTTKKLTDALMNAFAPSGVNFGTQASSTITSAGGTMATGASAAGATGQQAAGATAINPYVLGAVVVAAAASAWNNYQDSKFTKMTAEYKQGNQSLSKILGEGNKKSESIATGIETLTSLNGDVRSINNSMLRQLQDINAGIEKVAAGFAKTLTGAGDFTKLGIKEYNVGTGSAGKSLIGDLFKSKIFGETGNQIGSFINSIGESITKAFSSKSKKVIDSGIQIMGTSLVNLMSGATIEAFNYADVKTTKRVLGVKTSVKVKRSTEELDELFREQFSDIFRSAGETLKTASAAFGINFDSYINQLQVKAQDLSLKGIEGDALTKEIQSFFSSTMDSWAETLLGGTDVLIDFQQVGETAFDTMIRLAAQTNTLTDYVKSLGLNFNAVGIDAIYATQALADASGGFDSLNSKLANYYDKFFSESQKASIVTSKVTEAFKSMNISIPKTRDEFQNIVSAQDLLTESGANTFNQLLDLVPLLDQYYTNLGDLQQTTADNNIMSAKQLLEYSIKMRDAANDLKLSDLSPLKTEQKLAEAREAYNKATGEDIIAAGRAYLEQARAMFASSQQYTNIFNEVQSRLLSEADKASAGLQPTLVVDNTVNSQAVAESTADTTKEQTQEQTNILNAVSLQLATANSLLQKQVDAGAAALAEEKLQTKQYMEQSAKLLAQVEELTRKTTVVVGNSRIGVR